MASSDRDFSSRVPQSYGRSDLTPHSGGPANLADILERVLDKGIVIAGDIQINLLDIELLTIKLRLRSGCSSPLWTGRARWVSTGGRTTRH
jgi:hypothetical protein